MTQTVAEQFTENNKRQRPNNSTSNSHFTSFNPNINCFARGKLGHSVNKFINKKKLEHYQRAKKDSNNNRNTVINIMNGRINFTYSGADFGILDSGCTTTSVWFSKNIKNLNYEKKVTYVLAQEGNDLHLEQADVEWLVA